ncbi:tellurite resistance protein TehA-like permease [Amycolatopsis bartoniae]|uniref:C4-dicarboxylate ABC transporter n=1 Tax=Amycolatopsis bartoniae TaxID=941986 RepID=A0A8H9MED3_9PSEU|nr:TDT family transporter [Amycolatopsis bartoniae]MBB2937464.1 tellurite resistance protein TehA-like permease [Amycolatopsis bartoniae]TVS99113.1 C4-dicarboxylate ABC transporter [Amycolatopsis bartoniae]GHF86955.1 C4-dicarboxylate ABC transporter [Amycolatopsis bartoniae]
MPLPRAGTTPNWFASVMGTGIVANAVPVLPVHPPGLRGAATVVWAFAAGWLVVLCGAMGREWWRNASGQLAHLRDPVLAHFWGAPPMALLTVGAGTLALGRDWIGLPAALVVAWVLWSAGTALGLVTAVGLPYRMIMGRVGDGEAFGGWLMPVVPPMVSAATGAALVPHLPAGQARLTMVLGCYALFGVSLFATLALLPLIWQSLVRGGPGSAPTVWLVLGPLGQSITAANLLGTVAPFGSAGRLLGLVYGVPTWGFAMLWLVLAAAVVLRAALPFSLTWWSFTFPLGTCVTGTCALAEATGSELFAASAVVLYLLLVALWATVAVGTATQAWSRPAAGV